MSFKTSKYASSFSPQDVPGLVVWLDAADSRTLTMVGSNVSRWNDKVTNGTQYATSNIFTGPTLGTVNGVQALRFTSSAGSGMRFFGSAYTPKTTGFSYFFTFYATSLTTWGARIFHAHMATDRLFMVTSNSVTVFTGSEWAWSQTTPVFDNLTIATAFEDTSAMRMIANGSLATSAPTPAATAASTITEASVGTGFAGADRLDGFMCEILFYNRNLPIAERQLVEGYLRRKWSRTFSSNHPYAIVPPVTRSFNPLDISGCALWLDAADYSAFTLTGTSVTSWRDKSGNGCNAVGNSNTGIYSSNGFNSLPTVQFTPSNNMKVPMPSGTFPTGIAVFMVYQKTGANNTFDMGLDRSQGGNPSPFNSRTSDPTETYRFIGGAGGFPSNLETTTNLWRRTTPTVLFMGIFSNTPTTWNESINGAFTTYTTTSTTYVDGADGIYIGARSDFSTVMRGNISEIIAYKVPSITSQQRQQVELYLAEKWGLRSSLSTSNALRLYRALSPVFNPTMISNCSLWLDVADRATLTLSGSNITGIVDKSGLGISVSVSASRPTLNNSFTNGFPAAAFTGSQWFRGTFPSSYTGTTLAMFTVASVNSATSTNGRLLSLATAGAFDVFSTNAGILRPGGTQGVAILRAAVFGTSSVSGYNTPFIMANVYDGASVTIHINGASGSSNASSGSFSINSFGVAYLADYGGTDDTAYWIGNISEVIFYLGAITPQIRQRIEAYLSRKWKITLPTTHPYYSTPV